MTALDDDETTSSSEWACFGMLFEVLTILSVEKVVHSSIERLNLGLGLGLHPTYSLIISATFILTTC